MVGVPDCAYDERCCIFVGRESAMEGSVDEHHTDQHQHSRQRYIAYMLIINAQGAALHILDQFHSEC